MTIKMTKEQQEVELHAMTLLSNRRQHNCMVDYTTQREWYGWVRGMQAIMKHLDDVPDTIMNEYNTTLKYIYQQMSQQ